MNNTAAAVALWENSISTGKPSLTKEAQRGSLSGGFETWRLPSNSKSPGRDHSSSRVASLGGCAGDLNLLGMSRRVWFRVLVFRSEAEGVFFVAARKRAARSRISGAGQWRPWAHASGEFP